MQGVSAVYGHTLVLSENSSDVIKKKKKKIITKSHREKESRRSLHARNILYSRISEMVMLLQVFTFQYYAHEQCSACTGTFLCPR